jgi:hypothetical protein
MPVVPLAETLLEMARRHVAVGERLVAEQENVIERLRIDKHPTGEAEDLLSELKRALALQREHLDLEEQKAARK